MTQLVIKIALTFLDRLCNFFIAAFPCHSHQTGGAFPHFLFTAFVAIVIVLQRWTFSYDQTDDLFSDLY